MATPMLAVISPIYHRGMTEESSRPAAIDLTDGSLASGNGSANGSTRDDVALPNPS